MQSASLFRFNLRTLMFAMFVGTLAAWWAGPSVKWLLSDEPYALYLESDLDRDRRRRILADLAMHRDRVIIAVVGVPLSTAVFAYVMRRRDRKRIEREPSP